MTLPQELKDRRQFVVWGIIGRPIKKPFAYVNDRFIDVAWNNPANWITFDEAIAVVKQGRAQGIGFCFNGGGLYGIDLDNVFIDTENGRKLIPEGQAFIDALEVFTEYSMSGNGLHIFVYAPSVDLLASLGKGKTEYIFPGYDPVIVDGEPKRRKVEYHQASGYIALTGNALDNVMTVTGRDEELKAIYAKYSNPADTMPTKGGGVPVKAPQDHESDASYLKIGLEQDSLLIALWNGEQRTGNESNDDQSLFNKLAYWMNNNTELMKQAALNSPYYAQKDENRKKKWKRKDYLTRTINKAIAGTPTTARDRDGAYQAVKSIISENGGKNNDNLPWEPPTPLDNIVVVPSFPVECLPPVLGDYVTAVSESTQTPVDMAAVKGLAAMATCIQGKYKIQGKPDWLEPLNLYAVIVANPAERKSAVDQFLTQCIFDYEYYENQGRRDEINRSKAEKQVLEKEVMELIGKVSKGKGDKAALFEKQDELSQFQEVKPIRLIADDVSPEALTSLLADYDGRMSVISSEGGIFETLAGRYSNGGINIDTFLKAHSGDDIRVDRKGRDTEYIKFPCLTVSLSVQPQVLSSIMSNSAFYGRGLTARFLYCIPVSKVGRRRFESTPIPEDTKDRYNELCNALLNIKHNWDIPKALRLSPEAYAISAGFANALEPRLDDDLEGFRDWAGKLHGAILRIAGILHTVGLLTTAVDYPVSGDTMQAAIQIGDYFMEHARIAYQVLGSAENNGAAYILKRLAQHRPEKFSKRDLQRLCRGFKTTEDITKPLNTLIEYGYIREQQSANMDKGRPPGSVYLVNPLFYEK